MLIFWQGRGWWVTWIARAAMVVPLLVAREVDGPAVDRGVTLSMALAAALTVWLGLRLNRGGAPGRPAAHSFWGLPLQYWAVPMLVLAVLLGTGTITTAEEPRPRGAAVAPMSGGGPK